MTLAKSPKRQTVLDFIKAEIAASRPFPSSTLIAQHMGWKNSDSALDALRTLADMDRVIQRNLNAGRNVFSLKTTP